MRYITDTTEFQIEEPTIVTVGKFDGRHRGHQKLLRTMKQLKQELGYPTAIFTFSIAPLTQMSGQPQTVITWQAVWAPGKSWSGRIAVLAIRARAMQDF